ncbi:isochorismatase family cysteine hydrolase [Niveibacterium sp. SC-1]|uniref:cysteine hydrolase family protein n=1 Tax=Niveibacterium sp. SC-1 TaxID=3135646 RepID=UPI00311E7FF3
MPSVSCHHQRSFAFAPEKTALIVIDMQRDFLAPEGASGASGFDLAPLRAVIPRLQRVLQAARACGLPIYHTREGHKPDLSDLPEAKRLRSLAAGAEIGAPGPLGRFLVRGEYGHDFIDELQPTAGELVVDKASFGAFHATGLEESLRARGVTHLIVAGVTSQCCVLSTVHEANDRGFFCLTLEDCCAAFEPELHRAAMQIIASEAHLFGWIAEGESLEAALSQCEATC